MAFLDEVGLTTYHRNIKAELDTIYDMFVHNNFYAPLSADDESATAVVLEADDDSALVADWKYQPMNE